MGVYHKECRGCLAHRSELMTCELRPFYKKDDIKIYCPCLTCIIKGVCIVDCDRILDYKKDSI